MKNSLFSPLNIIIIAAVAVAFWYYMKHVHKQEVSHPAAAEVAEKAPVAPVEAEEAQ